MELIFMQITYMCGFWYIVNFIAVDIHGVAIKLFVMKHSVINEWNVLA